MRFAVIYNISQSFDYDFFQLYTSVGLWCQFFLLIMAFMEASSVMDYARR